MTAFTNEERLVILLSRTPCSESIRKEAVEIISSGIDWSSFTTIANNHGVSALMWNNINSLGLVNMVPPPEKDLLHRYFLKSLSRNTLIYELLAEAEALASGKGIKIFLLKGVALEKEVYGNLGLRQMSDIDILVKKEDAIPLRNLLLGAGFDSPPMISPLHEKVLPACGKHLPELYKNGIAVEIHHKLFEEKGWPTTEKFIALSLAAGSSTGTSFIPDPVMAFIYLVKHLAWHERGGFTQIRQYADLHQMLLFHRDVILTPALPTLASEGSVSGHLAEKLLVINTLWKTPLNEEWLEKIENCDRVGIMEKFIKLIRTNRTDATPREESLLKPLGEMETAREKALYIIGSIFPSLEFMKYRYKTSSSARALLYYPVRLFTLLKLTVTRSL